MRNEVQVNIKDLFCYILKQWKCLLIACVIGGVCLSGVFLVMELKNRAVIENPLDAIGEPEIDLDKLRATLTEEDAIEAEQALEFYLTSEKNYELLKEYVANSIKYRIDATHTPTYRVVYAIEGLSKSGNTDIQYEIFTILSNWIKGEEVINSICEKADMDVDAIYVQELLGVQYSEDTNCITISVIAPDKDMCEKLEAAVKSEIEQEIEELRSNYKTLSVSLLSEVYSVELNTYIQSAQYSQLAQLHSMKSVLTAYRFELDEKQQVYYDALYEDFLQEEAEEAEKEEEIIPNVVVEGPLFSVKIAILGALAGALVIVFYLMLKYLLSDTLKVKEDLSETFGQRVFCELSKKDDLALLVHNIGFIGKKNAVQKLLLTGTYTDEDTERLKEQLKEQLKGDIEIITRTAFESNHLESTNLLIECDAIICVERIGKSSYKKIESTIEACEYYETALLGFVVLK